MLDLGVFGSDLGGFWLSRMSWREGWMLLLLPSFALIFVDFD